jgi:hypothetical protein
MNNVNQIEMVCLNQLVPPIHQYRKSRDLLDFTAIAVRLKKLKANNQNEGSGVKKAKLITLPLFYLLSLLAPQGSVGSGKEILQTFNPNLGPADSQNNRNVTSVKNKKKEVKKIETLNGDKYEGEVNEKGIPNGIGKIICKNEDIYEGFFKDGVPHGYGTFTYSDGSVYAGEWKDGKSEGKGKIVLENKNEYEGFFKDGVPNGYGTFTWTDGSTYEGDWKDGKRDGQGAFTDKTNRFTYEGAWKNNAPMEQFPGKLLSLVGLDVSVYKVEFEINLPNNSEF